MRLTWSCPNHDGCLRLTGFAPATGHRIRVVLGHPHDVIELSALQSVPGNLALDDGGACFVPRYPFLPTTSVTILMTMDDGDERVVLSTRCPDDRGAPSTSVLAIHPVCAEIPRNQLKLYIEFSDRMAEGSVADRVRVCRADTGASIAAAFLPMEPELWDPERRRVTVLFDPARLKRGLAAHLEIGYPLQVGDVVDVVVDAGFVDAGGRSLVGPAQRRYVIGPDVRRLVRPGEWQLSAPTARTLEPLTVVFDRPLDHALLQHCLAVVDQGGNDVTGRALVSADDQEWTFLPTDPWDEHAHVLVVESMLEDLAGNSVNRVFDRDLDVDEHAPLNVESVSVPFTLRIPAPGEGRPL